MCASYGLGGGGHEDGPPPPLPPLNEKVRFTIDWGEPGMPSPGVIGLLAGKRELTGRRARNLNGIVRVDGGAAIIDPAWFKFWFGGRYDPSRATFNAKAENLATTWKGAFKKTRALVPATWFDEKKHQFRAATGEPFFIAAVWNRVHDEDGEPLTTYALVTRPAAGAVARFHDRMPLLLPADMWEAWLDPNEAGTRELAEAAVAASTEISEGTALLEAPEAGLS